jgi:hypothetical protein
MKPVYTPRKFGQFGPNYNVGSAPVAKWRNLAKHRDLTYAEKYAYGRAVLEAVGKQNRSAASVYPPPDLKRNARVYAEMMEEKRSRGQ